MAGLITMDGYDLSGYGIFAVRGSYNDLVKLPSFKEPSLYSWPDENNDDVDLTNRKVAASDITLTFLMSGDTMEALINKKASFFSLLQQDGYRSMYIATLATTYTMYYKSCESAQFIKGSKMRIKLVLKFRMNNSLVDL